jgi:type I restriction-modification system DNA methylase subunit
MTPKEKAKSEIQKLVNRFDEHYSQYKNSKYTETPTRRDFIDPFFKALGWDIDNQGSMAEAYREVIHEDKVKISGQLKSPDYSFRFNGKRYFFVEAKKPSVNIKDDSNPAYQVKRYAWSAKLKISIVTDFEEFAVYDCSDKPKINDKVTQARIHYFTYKDYLAKFDYIWDTFSKEAVESGSYDKYIQSESKKGSTSVDDEFLESLDSWRVKLAKDIFKHNSKLKEEELNFLVQHTIDRIIFLRIAEDRNVESYGSIQNCVKSKNSYKALFKLFENADDKYNSGLFDFERDKLSLKINISDDCLGEIVTELYFPKCSYEFSVIPVEILGSAYEQFLGKTIQITDGGKIKIEEKPEVRKAGGVFYTPQYIVEYIVKNTVGKLIEGKTPEQIEKIKILDPASGSGSFLLGAYQYLLDYHLNWYKYNKTKSKGKKDDPLNPDGSLKTDIKKKILINNIYGADLDANAVEVTKLSLLLKCLEGETQASINSQLSLFHERVLPTLDSNVKCGNSLVDTDYYEIETDREALRKIKPFNWKAQYPEVMNNDGFDVIIGNPPYVIVFNERIKNYLENKYQAFVRNNDNYVAFIQRTLMLLNKNGRMSFIVPNSFLTGEYFKVLRSLMSGFQINEIVNFTNKLIFASANVFTAIVNIQNAKANTNFKIKIDLNDIGKTIKNDPAGYLFKTDLISKLDKLEKLESFCIVKDVGYNYWSIGRGKKRGGSIGSKVLYSGERNNKKDIPYLKGGNIFKYKCTVPVNYLKHDYKKYLEENDIFRFSAEIMETSPKIIYRQTSSKLVGTIDTKKHHNDKTVHVILPKTDIDIRYILGLFNSKVLSYFYNHLSNESGRAFAQVKTVNVKKLPFIGSPQKAESDKIISYVDQLLNLNKSDNSDENQIKYIETQIDKLVYDLYGLDEVEIETLEGALNGNK